MPEVLKRKLNRSMRPVPSEADWRASWNGLAFKYKVFEDGEAAGVVQLAFTHAIVYGISEYGQEERWCYPDRDSAEAALDAWNGEDKTEPQGWHRHPTTGRRRIDGDPAQESVHW